MNRIIKKKRIKLKKEKSYLEFRISVLSPKRKFFGKETTVPIENFKKIKGYHKRIKLIKQELNN